MAANPPRKHHFLPRFYLRGFSNDGNGLYRIDKATGGSVGGTIRDLAAIRDFHRIDAAGTDDPFAFERKLGELEGLLAGYLNIAVEEGITSDEIKAGIAQFVSMMRFRVPATKRFIEQSLRAVVRSTGQIMERAGQLPEPPIGLEKAFRLENRDISIANWACLSHMFQLAFDNELVDILYEMDMELLAAPEDSFFITSDQPVSIYNPNATPNDFHGVALPDPNTVQTIALNSALLLKLSWNGEDRSSRISSTDEAAEYNRRTVVMAESYVFLSEDSQSIRELVSANRANFAGFDPPETLDVGDAAYHMVRFRAVCDQEQYHVAT